MLNCTIVKDLMACFEYVNKFYVNPLDALHGMLEYLVGNKSIVQVGANENKINRFLKTPPGILELEEFIHLVAQHKTRNKLFYYSTPKEVNRLMLELLELENNDTLYNPCFGIGSAFLSLNQNLKVKFYGEELDPKLCDIAKIMLQILNMSHKNIYSGDVIKNPKFIDKGKPRLFDKIICDLPAFGRIGMKFLQNDLRFKHASITGTYPELVFFMHSLSHLKSRGVFLMRVTALTKQVGNISLQKSLCEQNMMEAIVKLPPNLFPHKRDEFIIIVISRNCKNVRYIDASGVDFTRRQGKYNRLMRIGCILEEFKTPSKHSKIIPSLEFDLQSAMMSLDSHFTRVQDLGFELIRGKSVTKSIGNEIYYDVGALDFEPIGPIVKFSNQKHTKDLKSMENYFLKPYDVLLSLRGAPKVSIVGEINERALVHSGISILRHKDVNKSIALYCYLFCMIEKDTQGLISNNDIFISNDFEKFGKKWENILTLSEHTRALDAKIRALKND